MELPIAPVGRIIKNAGAERVSDDAKEALAKYLDYNAKEIASKAIIRAKHSGIQTVNEESMNRVIKNYHYHFYNPKDVYIDSHVNIFEYINIEGSFNEIYQKIDDTETEEHVKLIQNELEKDKINTSKIRSSIDWLKRNANWTLLPLTQILINIYGLTLPH